MSYFSISDDDIGSLDDKVTIITGEQLVYYAIVTMELIEDLQARRLALA